ncbi:DBF4-type zinc finger-containing protein 2 [Tupaia chinensis]|uniref:DBF4-type zinc finger-containing protein 2 n=1 Tax=Tupaia chinensis TaxID=246437 RepID=L9L7B2_TUPCH|nr:DBF4-type zinc finger-containing protein 2 [Tupaia chinensis]
MYCGTTPIIIKKAAAAGAAAGGETPSTSAEPVEDVQPTSSKSQESTMELSVRPSVIQKLEKGQQQPLEFVPKTGSGMKKSNPVDIGQATNNGKNLMRPPVIYSAPASCLSESSYDRSVITNATKLLLGAHLDSVSKCDPNKVDRHFEQLDRVSRNPVPSSYLETSSVSYQKPKESNGKVCKSNRKGIKSQGKPLSSDFTFHELRGTEGSFGVESPSESAVNSVVKLNKTNLCPNKVIFKDVIPKHQEESFSDVDYTQEENNLVFNKSAFLKQKCSVNSEMRFDYGSYQSALNLPQESVQDLSPWKEEQIDQENKNYGSRGSQMIFDPSSSFLSLIDQSTVTTKESNFSAEVCADLQFKNNKSCTSEISSDYDDSLQLGTNQSQVIVKETGLRNAMRISLVDQSYESSSSEMNFDCDDSLQSTSDYLQQPAKEVNFHREVHIDLVDKNYGSSSSEVSAESVFPLQSVIDQFPVTVPETKLQNKVHIVFNDKNCGSNCSETSSDCDVSLQSVVDRPQLTVTERNQKEGCVHLKDNHKFLSTDLDSEVSLETMAEEPVRAVEINLMREKNGDLDMNCESHAPEMGFHADGQLVAGQSQEGIKEVNSQKEDTDLESKSVQSIISNLSFDSHASLYPSANDQLQGALDEANLNALNVDMEVNSYEYSSSELTFDSDPVASVIQLNVERMKEHNLEESCESSGSEITFDSDILACSAIDLENKSNESCVSEITFDSDITLHSESDQPELVVNEISIQKEKYIHLERKNDESTGSKVNLDSFAPLHSVTKLPDVAVKKLHPQKEEQVYLENKEKQPGDPEVSLNYDIIFQSVTEYSEVPVKETNLQKEKHLHLENKGNKLSASETSLHSDIPLQESVTKKPKVVIDERQLQKEKHTEFQSKRTEFSDSEINLSPAVPHYSVTNPQVAVKKTNRKKKRIQKNKTEKVSDVLPQSMTEQPQVAVLKEDHVDPESEINLYIDSTLHSVTDQPLLCPVKEEYVDLEDKNSETRDSEMRFDSDGALQSLPGQLQKTVKKTNLWEEKGIDLEGKIEEPNGSKLVHDGDISLHLVANLSKVAMKQINFENEDNMSLEIKNSQYSCPEMSLNSDFLAQSIADRPQITILEHEHMEQEGKDSESYGSEISFDSDDPLQSVADQLRETVKEISLWKDEDVYMEDKRDEAQGFEILYDSDVLLESEASQTEEVDKETSLWKEHVVLEDNIGEHSDSKINFNSQGPHQCVTNKIQEAKEHVCLDDKGYEHKDPKIIYVSDLPIQSVIEQPQILEEERASLGDKSSDPCSPEISFDSKGFFQSAGEQFQQSVKEINLWKEDHIYLEDKSYKLGDFEVSYDSDVAVQFMPNQPAVSVKEINLHERNHDDLGNKNYKSCGSKTKCVSGIHLRSEVDQSQVAYKETKLQKEEPLNMEEKTNESSDSEMVCDSHVPFQIVVNQFQMPVKEINLPKMVLVDPMTSDSDCEVISDSDLPLQLVTDPSQITVKDINCLNAEGIDVEEKSYDSCGSEVRYVFEAPLQSVTNQLKETFKIINRKKDYIILGDSSCQSCGPEINFNVDASNQTMTYQSQEPVEEMVKYISSEDKSCESNNFEGNFNLEGPSQSVTLQLPEANNKVDLRNDLKNVGLKDKSCESNVSAVGCDPSSESVTDKEQLFMLNHTALEGRICEPCVSHMNTHYDLSLHSGIHQPQGTVTKMDSVKKVSFNLEKKNHDFQSSSVPILDSVRNLEKAKEVIEDNPDEPVLEALPNVPPSFVGKTWSQIMIEDDMKINALVKEFREGRFHCYFDDDRETGDISLNEEKKNTWADRNWDIASIQAVSDHGDIAGGISDTDNFSVALNHPPLHPPAERFPKQKWHVSSCEVAKVSHGAHTKFINFSVMKRRMVSQEEGSPKRKHLRLQSNRKTKKVKSGTVEFPVSCTKMLRTVQPKDLFRVLSSLNIKLKDGESFHFSKMKPRSGGNNTHRLIYKCKKNAFNNYHPLIKQIVIKPPLNVIVPESVRRNRVRIRLNKSIQNSSEGDDAANGQSSASAPFRTVPARYRFNSFYGTGGSAVHPEKPAVLSVSEVPKKSNFRLTLLTRDVAKMSPKSVRNKFVESKGKEKIQGKKVTTNNKPRFPQEVYKPVILRQKNRIASEESIWIRTKPNDIIRKYISKYSVFLRHRYQSRSAFIGMHRKKKSVVSKPKKAKKPAKTLLQSSVPPAGAEEQLKAVASPPPKQPERPSSSDAGRKKNGNTKCPSKKKKPIRPVREYALRSLSYIPHSDRIMTRLANKLRSSSEAK